MAVRWLSKDSRIRRYQYSWLACVGLVLALRFTVFAESNDRFIVAVVFMMGTWIPMMILNVIEGGRLMSYLKENHNDKWSELTYVPGFGFGGMNSFRTLPWLYSGDDRGDSRLASLKQQHRDFIRLMVTALASYLILMPVLLF
jgi:hypothetical protein